MGTEVYTITPCRIILCTLALVASCHAFLLSDSVLSGYASIKAKTEDAANMQFTYFDIRGRGEITRLLFAAAKKQLNEVRVQFADWPKLKPTMPFGQLPLLNISGSYYAQSLAIQAYIAKEFGMYPTNNRDALMTDQIALAREDLLTTESKVFGGGPTTTENNATLAKANPLYLGNFNKFIQENPTKSGFVIGNKMSFADIVLLEGTQTVFQTNPTILDQYPELKTLRAKVAAQDGVKQYLLQRPFIRF